MLSEVQHHIVSENVHEQTCKHNDATAPFVEYNFFKQCFIRSKQVIKTAVQKFNVWDDG
jgi:hypothetical protein